VSFLTLQRQEVNILTKNRSSIKKTKKKPNLLKVKAEQSSSLLLHFQNSSESYQLHKCTYLLRDGSQSIKSLSRVWPCGLQHTRLPCPSPTPRACSSSIKLVMPSNHLLLCHPLLLLPSIFPSIRVFSVSQSFASGSQSIGVSASPSVLLMNIQDWFPLWLTALKKKKKKDWLLWSPCSPRDSQESSPTPQFKSINSSALSFLYSPTLTSIHDHWKNHSFD